MSLEITDKLNHAQIEYLFKGIKLIDTSDASAIAALKREIESLA